MTVLYSFDPTGLAADNLVIEEAHAVTEAHYRDYHFLIPDFAPFYADGLVIRLAGSDPDLILTPGVDYYEVLPYEAATRSIGKPLYGAIALNSRWTTGVLLLTYQTLGGKWVADRAWVYKTLAERAYNPRTTVWDVLTNVTDTFPPINHTQNFSDFYDEGHLIQAIVNLGTDIAREADALPVIRHLRDHNNPHGVTLSQLNLSIATPDTALHGEAMDALITPYTLKVVRNVVQREQQLITNGIQRYVSEVLAQLERHRLDLYNPHQVTKDQLGLSLVGNWAMADNTVALAGTSDTTLINPARLKEVGDILRKEFAKSDEDLGTRIDDTVSLITTHAANKANPHQVTKDQLGLGLVGNWAMADTHQIVDGKATDLIVNPAMLEVVRLSVLDNMSKSITTLSDSVATSLDELTTALNTLSAALTTHAANKANPHQVTKDQLGLGLVGDWAMADKTVALAGTSETTLINPVRLKEVRMVIEQEFVQSDRDLGTRIDDTVSLITTHAANKANPHQVTKSQIGLDLVENYPIASDLEVANGEALNKYVTLRQIVNFLGTRGGLLYTLIPRTYEITEGEALSADMSTSRVANGSMFYWSIVHGTTAVSNFDASSGVVMVTDNRAVITITSTLRPESDPDRTFSLLVRENSVDGRIVALSDPITLINVTRTPEFTLTASNPWILLASTTQTTVRLTALNISIGTPLYWEIDHGTTTSTDFMLNSGEITWPGGTYDITINAYGSMVSRYISSFRVALRLTRGGTIIGISDMIVFEGQKPAIEVAVARGLFDPGVTPLASTYFLIGNYTPSKTVAGQYIPANFSNRKLRQQVNNAVVFTLTSRLSSINEGDAVEITAAASMDIAGHSMYWRIIHNRTTVGDFDADHGTISFVGTAGTVTIQTLYRTIDSPTRSFTVELLSSETGGSVLASTGSIELINIDTATAYAVSTTNWSVSTESTLSLPFTVRTPSVDTNSTFLWKLRHLTTRAGDFVATMGVVSLTDHTGTFTVNFNSTIKRQTVAYFRVELWDYATPNALAVSANVTVKSELQATAILQLESLFDPFATINAMSYYWIGNFGKRTERQQPLIDHDLRLTTTTTTVDEGNPFVVTLTAVPYFDPVYFTWTIRHGTTTDADFVAITGRIQLSGSSISFSIATVFNAVNTATKSFYVDLRYEGDATVVASSAALSIGNVFVPDPIYSVTTNTDTYNTATTMTVPVIVNVQNTTVTAYTWSIVNQSVGNTYFDQVTGNVITAAGTGTFNITLRDAIRTISSAQFAIALKASGTSTVLTTSPTITVVSPSYRLVAVASSEPEGSVWDMMLTTSQLPNGTLLYWSVVLGTATNEQFTSMSGTVVSTGNQTVWGLRTLKNLTKDIDRTFSVQVHLTNAAGLLVAQTGQLTIRDVMQWVIDPKWMMLCCLYEATMPIDAADYFKIGAKMTLRR